MQAVVDLDVARVEALQLDSDVLTMTLFVAVCNNTLHSWGIYTQP
jgi:hypothetical protein